MRYLLVGGWNTLFGYGVYSALTYWLTGVVAHPYMYALVIGNIICITVAYVGYKFVVFKTKGNYLREYLRFYVVYGIAIGANAILLPLAVAGFMRVVPPVYAPYAGQAVLIPVIICCSYLGHRFFSFRPA